MSDLEGPASHYREGLLGPSTTQIDGTDRSLITQLQAQRIALALLTKGRPLPQWLLDRIKSFRDGKVLPVAFLML